jgi:hypothetical protein
MSMLVALRGHGHSIAVVAATAAVVAPCATAGSHQSHSCAAGYSYVGAASPVPAVGASARIRLSEQPAVGSGHVAAWVGVGGPGMGPGGTSEWLQTGIATIEGGRPHLYYEVMHPGAAGARYVELRRVALGEAHTFTVSELADRPDVWIAAIDGVRVSRPVTLPGSHRAFAPIATAENWDGGVAGACNRYGFDFMNVTMRADAGRAWQPFMLTRLLRDPAYTLVVRPRGFTALSR